MTAEKLCFRGQGHDLGADAVEQSGMVPARKVCAADRVVKDDVTHKSDGGLGT